jgi:hypothetical protein
MVSSELLTVVECRWFAVLLLAAARLAPADWFVAGFAA